MLHLLEMQLAFVVLRRVVFTNVFVPTEVIFVLYLLLFLIMLTLNKFKQGSTQGEGLKKDWKQWESNPGPLANDPSLPTTSTRNNNMLKPLACLTFMLSTAVVPRRCGSYESQTHDTSKTSFCYLSTARARNTQLAGTILNTGAKI